MTELKNLIQGFFISIGFFLLFSFLFIAMLNGGLASSQDNEKILLESHKKAESNCLGLLEHQILKLRLLEIENMQLKNANEALKKEGKRNEMENKDEK